MTINNEVDGLVPAALQDSQSPAWFSDLEWNEQKYYMRHYRRYYRERSLKVARGLAESVLTWSVWLDERVRNENSEPEQ